MQLVHLAFRRLNFSDLRHALNLRFHLPYTLHKIFTVYFRQKQSKLRGVTTKWSRITRIYPRSFCHDLTSAPAIIVLPASLDRTKQCNKGLHPRISVKLTM